MNLDPVIAIHGVGSHRLEQASERVRKAFDRASMRADVSGVQLDQFTEHSVYGMRDAVTLLEQCSESISNAAALPLPPSGGAVEVLLHRAGEWLYHSIFRLVLAAALTVIVGSPLIAIVVYVAFNSFSWDNFAWTGMAMRIGVGAVVLVLSVLVGLDLLRSLITRTSAPLWVTVRRSSLLALQPLILLLTIPVSARFGSSVVAFAT